MPMQTFQFQADTSYSLASTAAINRKSCDHCFLNRKTCDKVRGPAGETGDKCKRCSKDGRPCTFTPTVHLYHIADCVGKHLCRAKVIQSMGGGRKKDAKFKPVEITIVLDMDSELDIALFDYINKQPSLLAYNNRIKSFLAQDMLGLTEEQEVQMSVQKHDGLDELTTTATTTSTTNGSPTHGSKRTFEMDDGQSKDSTVVDKSAISPTQGPQKFRIMALIDAHQNQNQQQQQQQQQHQKSNNHGPPAHKRNLSRDRGRQQGHGHIETTMDMPLSPNSLSPIDALNYQHRRQSEALTSPTASLTPAVPTLNQMGGLYSNQSLHPYQQPQLQIQTGHRSTSPLLQPSSAGHSPTHNSPPSPLHLSFGIDTNFGSLSNTSHQNLPSLFQETLNVSSTQQTSRTSIGTSTSPMLGSLDVNSNMVLDGQQQQPQQPPPLVITTTNEDGNEVGFYYAVPSVTLKNPEYSDADIFQDFIMDADVLGEDFVWIAEDLFEDPTAEEAEATLNAMSVAAAAGSPNTPPSAPNGFMMDSSMSGVATMPMLLGNSSTLPINSLMNPGTNDVTMDGMMLSSSEQQQQQQQQWMHQGYSQTMQG